MSDFKLRLQNALDAGFLLDREIGGGGMSRVFLATERALQRRVVIKVLPPELAAGVNVERFRREIQLAAQLQHPHIVPVLAAGDDDGLLWYTMPYIEGESLRGTLKKQSRLPVRDVVRILHDVVDALAYAHLRGIVHRDIKPDNILTSGMHALVTDFGVAKALSASIPMAGGTTTGMAIGTPAYMAPEQLAADPAADHRVDLYAVGLLGYELLTGTSPFTGTSPQATLAAQLTVTPPSPHTALAAIPESLSNVIMHCLEKDASKRPASAQALLAELDALPPLTASQQSRPAAKRSRAWLAVPAALALVVAAFMVADRIRSAETESATGGSSTTAQKLKPRDAGPGGDRAPSMGVAKADSSADSVFARPAFRDSEIAPTSVDGSRAVAVPIVITRAESLAIAEAMLKRMKQQAATTPKDSVVSAGKATAQAVGTNQRVIVRALDGAQSELVDRESLLNEVRRIFTDSIAQAFARMETDLARMPRNVRIEVPGRSSGVVPLIAPPSDGRTRVVVSNFTNATGKREFGAIGRDAAQFLRAALPADRFDVIDSETTERAARAMTDRLSLGWGLRADFVVSGMVSLRADSLVLLTIFTDVRGGRFSRVSESVAPLNDAKRAFDPALATLNVWLDSARAMMARLPAGRAPRGGPGGPGAMPPGAPPEPRN